MVGLVEQAQRQLELQAEAQRTSTGGTAIVNTAGNNVPPFNIINYHTIMSLPPAIVS
jgi:hypothetical protein